MNAPRMKRPVTVALLSGALSLALLALTALAIGGAGAAFGAVTSALVASLALLVIA